GATRDGAAFTWGAFVDWREERRREKQRRDVIAKHTKKGAVPAGATVAKAPPIMPDMSPAKPERAPALEAAEPSRESLAPKPLVPARPPKLNLPAPLPLPDPEPTAKAPAERRKGEYALPPVALLDAAKAERK